MLLACQATNRLMRTAPLLGVKDIAMKPHRSGIGRCGASLSIAALAWSLSPAPSAADDAKAAALGIELNKLEDSDQGCRSVFVFDNRTGHDLNRFRIDLILFDAAGVYSKQLLLDMAPMHQDKKTVTSFLLHDQACSELGSVLVNDVPWCENGSGTTVDCVRMLEVSSLAKVPLHK
jgi:hypothetical protein